MRTSFRLALAFAAAGTFTLGGGAAFAADGGLTPLPASEVAAATSAAADSHGLGLARRVVEAQSKRPGSVVSGRDAGGRAALVAGTTTQVNILAADFVSSGRGPVGRLGYVSNSARVGDALVSVWTVKGPDGAWKAVNAASGDTEARLGRRAQGGQVLNEPQINAWYAVKGDRVLPLNDEAQAVVGHGVSLQRYQQLVHAKYADKMPGSAYDRSGMAGGFGQPAPQAAPAAAPAQTAPAPVDRSTTLLAGAGLFAAVGLAGFALSRRGHSRA